MTDSNEELMSQVKAILDEANADLSKKQMEEAVRLVETVSTSIGKEFEIEGDKVLLFMMYQTPVSEVDKDNVLNAHLIAGLSDTEAEARGFSGGSIQMPFTFDSMSDAVENMNSRMAAVMADMAAEGKGWATITAHKHQATTIYMCVAGGSLTVTKVLPTGDKLSESRATGGTMSTPPAVESLPSEASPLAEAQWQFTAMPQVLRQQYPKAYKAMVTEIMSKLEGMTGDDE